MRGRFNCAMNIPSTYARARSNLARGRGAERKTCPKLDPALAPSGFQMSWSADFAGRKDPMILLTHQRPSQGDAAPPSELSTLDRESCSEAADAGAELERRLRWVGPRKWAARKRENAVLCASSLHTSAGAMDRNGGDPVHSIAELVARGSAQPPDRSKQPYHGGGAWCGSADGYFARYFAPRCPDRRSRPDRGYAAIDRTRALGARVGRRVGEPGDLGGAQIWAAARIMASSRGL